MERVSFLDILGIWYNHFGAENQRLRLRIEASRRLGQALLAVQESTGDYGRSYPWWMESPDGIHGSELDGLNRIYWLRHLSDRFLDVSGMPRDPAASDRSLSFFGSSIYRLARRIGRPYNWVRGRYGIDTSERALALDALLL